MRAFRKIADKNHQQKEGEMVKKKTISIAIDKKRERKRCKS